MRNMQPFSDVVVLAIKSAMAPVLERLAATEQANRELQARVTELVGMRDRLTAVETKAALPGPTLPDVDLSPVLERLAATEQVHRDLHSRVTELVGLRDRVTAVETKAAQPMSAPVEPEPVDLTPVLERVAGVEARLSTLGDLRDRVVTIETKSSQPPVTTEIVTTPSGPSAADIELSMRDKLEPLTKEVGALRERLIAVEVRQPMPGPPGKDGQNGVNGKDGLDGMGWDDLSIGHDGERTFTVKLSKGERVKEETFTVPVDIYRGVYVDGKSYDRGDGVTWAGSEWHCLEPTASKPGDGSKAWVLKVKRGRDGRDGKDAPIVPVVKVS